MKIHSIYDNGGETLDRYAVYYKGRGSLYHNSQATFRYFLSMSENPSHPQGYGQHGWGMPGKHNGKRIKFEDLPEQCQKLVLQDLTADCPG